MVIIGVANPSRCLQNYVLQSYTANGTSTDIGTAIANELIAQQLGDIDQANALYVSNATQ